MPSIWLPIFCERFQKGSEPQNPCNKPPRITIFFEFYWTGEFFTLYNYIFFWARLFFRWGLSGFLIAGAGAISIQPRQRRSSPADRTPRPLFQTGFTTPNTDFRIPSPRKCSTTGKFSGGGRKLPAVNIQRGVYIKHWKNREQTPPTQNGHDLNTLHHHMQWCASQSMFFFVGLCFVRAYVGMGVFM